MSLTVCLDVEIWEWSSFYVVLKYHISKSHYHKFLLLFKVSLPEKTFILKFWFALNLLYPFPLSDLPSWASFTFPLPHLSFTPLFPHFHLPLQHLSPVLFCTSPSLSFCLFCSSPYYTSAPIFLPFTPLHPLFFFYTFFLNKYLK